MNIVVSVLFSIVGLFVGFIILDISKRIINYKNGIYKISENSFIYTKWFRIIILILNGTLWMITGLYSANLLTGLLIAVQITIGLIIGFIDICIRIIPNELVLTLLVLGIIFQILNYGLYALIVALLCMIIMMMVFVSVAAFVGFGKVGAGDVKLAGVIGLALGYPLIITAIYAMAIVLLIYISAGMATKKISLATMFPLAPFLISGYVTALISMFI